MDLSRRRSERIPTRIAARWTRAGGDVELTIADASQHGIFISTRETASPGALMQLAVTLSGGSVTMCVIARFVGQTQNGYGIGAEIYLMGERERRMWTGHYKSLLRASKSTAHGEAIDEVGKPPGAARAAGRGAAR